MVNIINYSWIYIYKKIFKFSKPSILEDRIWDTDISSSTSMDITFNTLNTMCFTLKIIVSWSFGNKIVIFMDDRSKSSNKSCDKFCIFASCSPPPWEEAQWHMLIKLWVAFVAIHLCPCALSLLFFLSLVNLLSSFLCAEKPLQAQLRSSSCARREIDGCLLLNIVVFHTIICLFSALSWEMQQSFKIIGSSILKKIRCNITRLCCVSFNMNIVEIQLDDLDNRSWNNNIFCKILF